METAVIYARYSCENQTEQSIEGQLRVCEEYAKNKDILILNTYIDRAMTGTNDNRPDFQRMLKDSQKREWNYVIVYKLDRFSRNKYEMAMHKKTLKDYGVKLISATEYIPDTPEAIIIESMLEGYAEYYSAELSQKVRRGMKESWLKGNYTGGQMILGYTVENHKVQVVEEEADIVRMIFQKYLLGVMAKQLVEDLNRMNITNKGRPFNKNTIYHLLRNEKYAGIVTHGGVVYDNIFPAIIEKDVYEKVKEKNEKNRYGKKSVRAPNIFRNKVVCGYCGSNVTADSGTARNGSVKRYYKCIGRKHNNGCQKAIIQQNAFEQIVIDALIKELSVPENKQMLISKLMKYQKEENAHNAAYEALKKEKKKVDSSLNNIVKAVEEGLVNKTMRARMKELEQRQEELERELLIQKSKMSVEIPEKTIEKYYEEALRLERTALVSYLVNKIVLFDEEIHIYLNTPLMSNPDNSRDCFNYKCKTLYTVPYYIHTISVRIRV